MTFNYDGFDARASRRTGTIVANTVEDAAGLLRGQGIFPTDLQPSGAPIRRVLEAAGTPLTPEESPKQAFPEVPEAPAGVNTPRPDLGPVAPGKPAEGPASAVLHEDIIRRLDAVSRVWAGAQSWMPVDPLVEKAIRDERQVGLLVQHVLRGLVDEEIHGSAGPADAKNGAFPARMVKRG
jgi:hypothetical protein